MHLIYVMYNICRSIKTVIIAQNFNAVIYDIICYMSYSGHAVAQWLRHCATNRKVAGLIPDGVIGVFR
jgi:hypothetical protein